MSGKLITLTVVAVVLMIGGSVLSNTYYVKPGGNDASTGLSWSAAWRTVAKVNTSMKGGDTCYFGPGTFPATHLAPAGGGTASDRTAYISGDGVTNNPSFWAARLCGGDSLPATGWTQNGNVFSRPYTPTTTYEAGHFYVMGQNDSMITFVGSIPTTPGHFYYDGTTLYVYLYSINGLGYNPASYGVWTGTQIPVDFSATSGGANYVTLLGFDIRYSRVSGVFFGWSQCSYALISHCKVQYNGQGTTGNGALIGSRSQQPDAVHNTIRSCYLDYSTIDPASQEPQAYATDFYTQSWLVIESCYVGPHISEFGLYFKGSPISSTHITYRYNQVNAKGYIGIYVRGKIDTVLAYGNQIYNCNNTGIGIGNADAGSKYVRIENNSIQMISGAQGIGLGWYLGFAGPVIIRRNIITGGTYDYKCGTVGAAYCSIDSNMYYTPTSTFSACGGYGGCEFGSLSWSGWLAYGARGWDAHSKSNVNPNFVSASTGDLSRPTSSAELSAVLPDGTPVTRYGAWQPKGAGGGTFVSLERVVGLAGQDTIRVGSNVRWIFRVINGDSASYNVSNGFRVYSPDGATWDSTSADTLGRPTAILGRSKFDLNYAINKFSCDGIGADTVGFIAAKVTGVGLKSGFSDTAWAVSAYDISRASIGKHICIDSAYFRPGGVWKWSSSSGQNVFPSWSGPRCYTVVDTGSTVVVAPDPVNSLVVGSVLYDASGKPDSLQINFGSGAQTWPDSVIYSMSATSSLPTNSQTSDRWAIPFSASKNYVVFIPKAFAVPDTITVGVWVKDVKTGYSTPSYVKQVFLAGLVCSCTGTTGNVDGSADGSVDMADLVALDTYLFQGGSPSSICMKQANTDGSPGGSVDINDLSVLISYLFGMPGAVRLAPCQ